MPATDELPVSSSNRRGRALAGLILGLTWLTVAAGVLVVGVQAELARNRLDDRSMALLVASLVVQIAAPVAVVALALLALRRSGPDASARIAALEARQARAYDAGVTLFAGIDTIDRALANIGDRLVTLQADVGGDAHGLDATARRLETATAAMHEAARTAGTAATGLQALIDGSQHQAEALAALLQRTGAETTRQLEGVETMLAAVWSRNADAAAQVAAASTSMRSLLADVETAAGRATVAVGDHAAALHGTADVAFDRTTAALDATRDGVHAQTAALLASVDQARVALDHIGGDAARAISRRLDRLNEAADQLGQRLSEQDARSRVLVDTVERSFNILDTRLDNASKNSHGALDSIAEHMVAVGHQVQNLNTPLRETHAAALEIEAAVSQLHIAAGSAIDAITHALPVHRENIGLLDTAMAQLHTSVLQLGEPVEQGRLALGIATSELAAQRVQIETATAHLVAQFEIARAVLGSVEAQAEGSALAASNQLIEVLGRVREIAVASAGQMRETLAAVVVEAETALAQAGGTRAEAAFGAPIRGQLAAIEAASRQAADAAQGAADRVAQRLLGLTGTVAAVEARVDEVQTHFDMQARDDLLGRSSRLLDSLNAASIDIARLLTLDIGDQSWDAYLKGDRSIFTRRVVRLADAATSRAVKRHYTHDPAFRELAVQYIDEFERLLKHVDADKDGHTLAITMVSSDVGKLYVVLAQAIDRLR